MWALSVILDSLRNLRHTVIRLSDMTIYKTSLVSLSSRWRQGKIPQSIWDSPRCWHLDTHILPLMSISLWNTYFKPYL